jgi:hypothetical protein
MDLHTITESLFLVHQLLWLLGPTPWKFYIQLLVLISWPSKFALDNIFFIICKFKLYNK